MFEEFRKDVGVMMLNTLPTFIHVGPPRTGTTWLHEVLKHRANLPEPKETRFFDEFYRFGLAWYSQRFSPGARYTVSGEFYPGYFANPLARLRIRQHIPDCKILCTFREPAARLYSMWRIIRARRLPVEASFEAYWRRVVSRGSDICRYASHLEAWQRDFGRERVLVLFYEDLNADPQRYLDTVCDFVGIPPIVLKDSPVGLSKVHDAVGAARVNPISQMAGKAYSELISRGPRIVTVLRNSYLVRKVVKPLFVEQFDSLDPRQAEEIRAMSLVETERLEELTGRDLSTWKPQAKNGLSKAVDPNQWRHSTPSPFIVKNFADVPD